MCNNTERITAQNTLDEAFALMSSGQSCIIKGRAGTGKSTLIIKFARESSHNIIKTATTGMASMNIDGQTISRFLNLGIYKYSDEEITERNKYTYLDSDSILVIDESYMLNADQMHQIDIALRAATEVNKIFGGLQVILSGDDCQLLPFDEGEYWAHEPFFRDLPSINLNYSFRHENDLVFLGYLNILRSSIQARKPLDPEVWWKNVLPHVSQISETNKLIIAPHYAETQLINRTKQMLLASDRDVMTLRSETYGPEPQDVPYEVQEVTVGTPVVHTLNRNGLVSGSMGVITDLDIDWNTVYVDFDGDVHSVGIEDVHTSGSTSGAHYIPLIQAFSLTARKVQGLTLTSGVVSRTFRSLSQTEENIRCLYVAMSRFTTLQNLEMCFYN